MEKARKFPKIKENKHLLRVFGYLTTGKKFFGRHRQPGRAPGAGGGATGGEADDALVAREGLAGRIGLVKVVPWRGTYVIDVDEHAANEVYELWKSLFGVVCRLAAAEMSDRDGRELMHRLVEYKDVTQRTENTFEHIKVSNRIGRFIAKRSNAPLALELLDRVALLARWQHNVYTNSYIETHGNEAGRQSAILYDELCRHIVARDGDAADAAARELIGVTQSSFGQALEEYKARHAKPKPGRRRAKAT